MEPVSSKLKITADDLPDAVHKILNDYADDVASALTDAIMITAKETLRIVKEKAPKRTGDYREGWTITREKGGFFDRVVKAVIHNKTRYRIAHLLENGYQKATGGRVEGRPHLRTAEQEAIRMLPELVEQEIGALKP
jgi:hypothetical protein